MLDSTSNASMIPAVVMGVLWFAGSVAAVTLSLVGWRRTGRPFFAGAAWFFALGFAGPVASGLSGILVGAILRIFDDPRTGTVYMNVVMFLLGTLLPAAGLLLLLRGARADTATTTGDGGVE